MSNFRVLTLLTAAVGFLVWVSWFSSTTEPENITVNELYGAAGMQDGVERIYQGFRR